MLPCCARCVTQCRLETGLIFFFQAEVGIRVSSTSRGLVDVYKRQAPLPGVNEPVLLSRRVQVGRDGPFHPLVLPLSKAGLAV